MPFWFDTINLRWSIGLNNINSGKVHDIHRYNVKIIGSDSKPVAYLDHHGPLYISRSHRL